MFQPQREGRLRARIVTFDVPGVGESAASPGLSINGMADIAAGLLDAERIDRAVIGGVSMGGYAAFAFARRHASRMRGLILANTKPEADTEQAKQGRAEMAAVARSQGATEIANRMLPKLVTESTLRERQPLAGYLRNAIKAIPAETIAQLLEALAGRDDSTGLLAEIRVPTLVIAGEHDAIMPIARTREWVREIPGAALVEINAGHLPNLEQPEAFNQVLRTFLPKIEM
jgi:pimeloyl-ACP methyl ester carboxylesterase